MLGMFLDFIGLMLFIILASSITTIILFLAIWAITLLIETFYDLANFFNRKGRK